MSAIGCPLPHKPRDQFFVAAGLVVGLVVGGAVRFVRTRRQNRGVVRSLDVVVSDTDAFKEAAASYVGHTRRMPACSRCSLLESISDPSRFQLVEMWDTPETLGEYLQTDQAKAFATAVGGGSKEDEVDSGHLFVECVL